VRNGFLIGRAFADRPPLPGGVTAWTHGVACLRYEWPPVRRDRRFIDSARAFSYRGKQHLAPPLTLPRLAN
jgi:hypothetical protein